MSKVLIEEQTLYNIADAVRSKLSIITTYKPGELATAISSIASTARIVVLLDTMAAGTYADGTLVIRLNTVEGDVGWTCDNEYLVTRANTYLSSHSGTHYKALNGAAIGVEFRGNDWYGPFLVSTIANNVNTTYNQAAESTSIDGVTWYISGSAHFSKSEDSQHALPALYDPVGVDPANRSEIIAAILEASNMRPFETSYASGSLHAAHALQDIYAVVNGSLVSILDTNYPWTWLN